MQMPEEQKDWSVMSLHKNDRKTGKLECERRAVHPNAIIMKRMTKKSRLSLESRSLMEILSLGLLLAEIA